MFSYSLLLVYQKTSVLADDRKLHRQEQTVLLYSSLLVYQKTSVLADDRKVHQHEQTVLLLLITGIPKDNRMS